MMLNPQRTPTTMELLLLPVVCLSLLSCCGQTSADETGRDIIKMNVKEGTDAILPCSFPTSVKTEIFDWKKDRREVFLYDNGDQYNNGREGQDLQFKGRVFHFPQHLESGNASIVIRDTKVTDSGNYTCDFPRHQPPRRSHISLVVGSPAEPSVTTLDQTKDWSLLQCVVRGASPKPKLQWQDSAGNILPAKEPQVTERGGSYDITLQTTVTKTDRYRCVATQEEIGHRLYAEIYVYINGAASKPYVTTLDQTKDWSLLQCEVQGASPKPKVEWQDSAGNILPAKEPQVTERGGSYDITLQTTVTKTDRYRCVATQEEVGHQTDAETFVLLDESPPDENKVNTTGWFLGGFFTLAGIILVIAVATCIIKRRKKGSS